MLFKLRQDLKAKKFDRQIAGIRETPPLRQIQAPWTIVSMVRPRDVLMYLLTLKQFYRLARGGHVVAIIDRDTPQPALAQLREHVPFIEFVILEDIDTGSCQRGGTWERLVYLIDRSGREYVIQLDCDTLAVAEDINEAVECARNNLPFTMADGWKLEPLAATAAKAREMDTNYVGIAAERLYDRYPGGENLRYVRGSSGFAGFSKGGFSRAQIEEYHANMTALLGDRWHEWGSEQCGSNFAVANSPDAVVLPHPQYTSFYPHADTMRAKFFHFIGAHRFERGFFAARAQEVIHALNHAPETARPAAASLEPTASS